MIAYQFLSKRLTLKSLQAVIPQLKTERLKAELRELLGLDSEMGLIIDSQVESAVIQTLHDNSASQSTFEKFGFVPALDPELKKYINHRATAHESQPFFEHASELSWERELIYAELASEYFPKDQQAYFENAVAYFYLLVEIQNQVRTYILPDWNEAIDSFETDFPQDDEQYLPSAYPVGSLFKESDFDDWHSITDVGNETIN